MNTRLLTAMSTLFVLALSSIAPGSPPLNVKVTLSGPGEHLLEELPDPPYDYYEYSASVEYSLDAETEKEIEDGEGAIKKDYSWSHPGHWESGGNPPEEPNGGGYDYLRIYFKHGETPGGEIAVTCTVIVEYADGTSDSASDTDSIVAVWPEWQLGEPISCAGIVTPADGAYVAVGYEVVCSVAPATDNDTRIGETTEVHADSFEESDAYTWEATHGSFKDNVTTGLSVVWIAPSEPPGNNGGGDIGIAGMQPGETIISVRIRDDAVMSPREDGDRRDSKEPPFTKSTKVNPVALDRLVCEGVESRTDEPGQNETVRLPVGYNNGSVTVTAFANPDGNWPPYKPAWSGDIASSDGPTAEVDTTTAGWKLVTAECGNSVSIWIVVVRVKLAIDSDNDGAVTAADANVKDQFPGKLIYWNCDDDDENRIVDYFNESTVPGEDDLAEIHLRVLPAGLSVGTVRLRATEGIVGIRVFTDPEKGADNLVIHDQVTSAEWSAGEFPGGGGSALVLYVEGNLPSGAFTLSLEYIVGGNIVAADTAKGAVVASAFERTDDTAYGFDQRPWLWSGAPWPDINSGPYDADTNPEGYGNDGSWPWVSVDAANKNTVVSLVVIPSEYAPYVHLVPEDPSVANCNPPQAAASPQNVTITGKASGITRIRARLGTPAGAEGARLNVASYAVKKVSTNALPSYKVRTSSLTPSETTWADLEDYANGVLAQAVVQLNLADKGDLLVEYDLNDNGLLDLYRTEDNLGDEYAAVRNKLGEALGRDPNGMLWAVLHVKAIQYHRSDGSSVPVAGLYQSTRKLIMLADNSPTIMGKALAHEVLHMLGKGEVGPAGKNTQNLMYYDYGEGLHIGYFVVEKVQSGTEVGFGGSFSPPQYDRQWDR